MAVIRDNLLKVFEKKITVSEWLDSWDTTLDNVFPLESCGFYGKLANYFLTKVDFKREQKINVPKKILDNNSGFDIHKSATEDLLKSIKMRDSYWKKFIGDNIEKRTDMKNNNVIDVIDVLRDEVDELPLLSLLTWTLRLTFACSSTMWNKWFNADNIGFHNLSHFLYITHAYKDKKIFDAIMNYGLDPIGQETVSLASLLGTLSGSVPVVRMIPWFGKIGKMDLLKLWAKGVHPISIMLHDVEFVDNFPMTGPILWIHDWRHTASHVCPNSIILSTVLPDADKLSTLVCSYWDAWNKFLPIAVKMDMTEREQHMLFFLVHEIFGSAVEKCRMILDTDFKIIVAHIANYVGKKIETNGVSDIVSQYLKKPLEIAEANVFAKRLKEILLKVADSAFIIPDDTVVLSHTIPFMIDMSEYSKGEYFNLHDGMSVKKCIELPCKFIKENDYNMLYGLLVPRHKPIKKIIGESCIDNRLGMVPYNEKNISHFMVNQYCS